VIWKVVALIVGSEGNAEPGRVDLKCFICPYRCPVAGGNDFAKSKTSHRKCNIEQNGGP